MPVDLSQSGEAREPSHNAGRLSELFQSAIDRQQERIEELGASDDERKQIAAGVAQARMILNGATDLVANKSVRQAKSAWELLLNSESDGAYGIIQEGALLAIDGLLGEQALKMQVSAEARFNHLLAFAREQGVGFYTRAFLCEIARCYLFGFDCQCIILCRAAVEAAYVDNGIGGQGALAERIQWSYDQGGRLEQLALMARFVNTSAKNLLHADRKAYPAVVAEEHARQVLMRTVCVVEALSNLGHNGQRPRS